MSDNVLIAAFLVLAAWRLGWALCLAAAREHKDETAEAVDKCLRKQRVR